MFNPLRGVVLATVCGSITPNIGGSITAVSDTSFKQAPQELVLDFDATDNPLHGQQEGHEGLDRTRTVSELVARANELPTLLQP